MGFLKTPHDCALPNLIFEYPAKDTKLSVGTEWQCDDCDKIWVVVSHMMWNEWRIKRK